MPAPSFEEREDARRPAPFPASQSPLAVMRSRALFLAVLAACGALAAAFVGALLPLRYRAVASLLVAEPRLAGPGSVDYNLTPVRSYAALAGSRALAAPCRAALGRDAEVKVRIPENTRIVEISFEDPKAGAAAAFVSCVAQNAIAENERMNASLALEGAAPAAAALEVGRRELREAEERLASARSAALLESKKAALRAALDAVDAGSQEELRAALAAEEAAARAKALENGAGAEAKSAARAEEAGARSRSRAAAEARATAARRIPALEREAASADQELEALRRDVARADGAAAELARRAAAAPVEAAAKSFTLVLVSPPVPPAGPTRPPLSLFALAGGAAALAFGVLLSLSRP